jgi:hypothetical protein
MRTLPLKIKLFGLYFSGSGFWNLGLLVLQLVIIPFLRLNPATVGLDGQMKADRNRTNPPSCAHTKDRISV